MPASTHNLNDIARLVGCSPGSVSKALNGRPGVSQATRDKVLEVAARLGYLSPTMRNAAGTTARNGKTIGIVCNIRASPYFVGIFRGVVDAAAEAGIDLLTRTAPVKVHPNQLETAKQWIREQRALGLLGIIGITLDNADELVAQAAKAELPFVMIDPLSTMTVPAVSISSSNWAGARVATEHLIMGGHRRIGWIGGRSTSPASRDRYFGYQAALQNAGIELDDGIVRFEDYGVEEGIRQGNHLLALPTPPTAIMCGNDEIAVGVLRAAQQRGVVIPEQLSVIGFDSTPQAEWTTPRLTSVRQQLDEMGRMAVQVVIQLAGGGRPPSRHIELATTLVLRDSAGPAPSAE